MARGFRKFMRQMRKTVRKAAPLLDAASSVASFVPGAGTAVAAGLGAASAAARGQRLGNVLGRAMQGAIPGGSAVGGAMRGIQTASQVARTLGAGRGMRALRAPDPARALRAVPALRSATRSTEALARQILTRRPDLAAGSLSDIARRTGLTERAISRATRSGLPLQWQALSRQGSAWVQRLSSVTPWAYGRDVSGLSADGLTYVVENGDYPGKIAQKLTGSANRYPELYAANPQKKTVVKNGVRNFVSLYAGEKLTLPASWVKAPQQAALSEAVTLKSKAILAAWSKTDGASSSGPSDYGMRPEDVTPTWTERDRLVLKAFEFQARLPDQSGTLTQPAADALNAWAEAKAAQVSPLPSVGPAIVLPTEVISAPAPSGPVMMPNDIPPPVGSPTPRIPELPATTPPAALPPATRPPVLALPAPSTPVITAPMPTLPSDPPILAAPDEEPPLALPPPTGAPANDAQPAGDMGTILAIAGAAAALLFGV